MAPQLSTRRLLLGAVAVAAANAAHPASAWDANVDEACCAYPEHDPRDYNWPYSHLQYSEVIPDVTGSFVAMTELKLAYGERAVEYGKPIAPSETAAAPSFAYSLGDDRDASTLHTLLAVDPDVPFRDDSSEGERVLWLVYDIPGNETSRGKTLVEYAPPAPKACPAREKLCLSEHRVTFLLWEQPHGPLALRAEDAPIGVGSAASARLRYKARDFAARHRLGMQLAMNFFETSHDAADGTFYERPWWYVTDVESLAATAHLLPDAAGQAPAAAAAPAHDEL